MALLLRAGGEELRIGRKSFAEMAKASVAVAALAFLAVAVVALPMLARGLTASDSVSVTGAVKVWVELEPSLSEVGDALGNITLDFSDSAQLEKVFLAYDLFGKGSVRLWDWNPAGSRTKADEGAMFLNLSLMSADYVVLDSLNTTEFFRNKPGFVDISFYYRPVYPGHIASVGLETLFEDGSPDGTVVVSMRDDGAVGNGDFETRTEPAGNGWMFVTARNIAEIPKGRQLVLHVLNIPTVDSESFGLYLKDVRMGVAK